MTIRSVVVTSPRAAHAAIAELYQQEVLPHTSKGAAGVFTWTTVNEYRRHQLRKFFHGPVLNTIAEQVWIRDYVMGVQYRYVPKMWKQFFAQLFIAPTFEEYTVKRTGEVKLRECRRSTEALSDDEFADFVLQVQAWAATEHGVDFPDQNEGASHA